MEYLFSYGDGADVYAMSKTERVIKDRETGQEIAHYFIEEREAMV